MPLPRTTPRSPRRTGLSSARVGNRTTAGALSRLRSKACSTYSALKRAVGAKARRARVAARRNPARARALRSRVWRRRSARRGAATALVGNDEKAKRNVTDDPRRRRSFPNSLRDVRPALRVCQPHAGRGEQAELRQGLRVTFQDANGHPSEDASRARATSAVVTRYSFEARLRQLRIREIFW